MADTASRPLRKDAARNRDRILAAAAELFAKRGLDVTLNDIAHHAGVGVGTAYRRFSNKEEVIEALFEQRLEDVAGLARTALATADAWEGLTLFLDQALDMRHGNRGLNQIMNNPALGDSRVNEARDQIAPILVDLVDRAKAQGVVRDDFDQTDIIFIQLALSAVMEPSHDIAPDLYRRYLTMFLDGIRTNGDRFTPLPARALTAEETHHAMTHRRRSNSAT